MADLQARRFGDGLGNGANSVLGKARLILESFEIDDMDLSLSEISRRTGISKATVHRLSQELLDWGMLERSGCEYRLGMRAFELGARVPRFRVLRDAVRPFMAALHVETREAVHLAVLDGLDVLYLEKLTGVRQTPRPSQIAGRMPLHSTATGKMLLAFSPPRLLDETIERGLNRITQFTIVVPGVLAAQLRRVREQQYSVEREETMIGYCSVAVPLFGASGLILGSLSITAPTFRADIEKLVGSLVRAQRRIEETNLIN